MEIYQITNDNTLKISATKSNKKHGASIMALTVFASLSFTTSMINIKTNAKEGIASFTQPNLNKTENKPINNYNLNKDDKIELMKRNFISSNKNEIWNFNNEKLEVDDLADKVTQTQLDEVKAHFDTKISSLEKNLVTQFTLMLNESSGDLKKHFSDELKETNSKKVDRTRFLIGSIVVPIVSVIVTLLFTKLFKI